MMDLSKKNICPFTCLLFEQDCATPNTHSEVTTTNNYIDVDHGTNALGYTFDICFKCSTSNFGGDESTLVLNMDMKPLECDKVFVPLAYNPPNLVYDSAATTQNFLYTLFFHDP